MLNSEFMIHRYLWSTVFTIANLAFSRQKYALPTISEYYVWGQFEHRTKVGVEVLKHPFNLYREL